ncbi:Magnesium transport protein CorA, transmembrane region [Glarea lozoyensis ATCC 20868]|uniref:Magnesium transport protein CorA, transmembrane region n=1 Tax=Glarea lozoyensis (strain ATCC 20868 / MF5171) TaxID=1116229 RepID=S3CIZ6_GLAL2|nr:Magnesium transport protein CorA, transmembrane region [Glarea lozoyensis ATCC 20868]EPE26482.1 Magnesium transport protein CorA, transmembrane region [Glarea lozoyensis ATCC 20868]
MSDGDAVISIGPVDEPLVEDAEKATGEEYPYVEEIFRLAKENQRYKKLAWALRNGLNDVGRKPTFGYIIDFEEEYVRIQHFIDADSALLFPGECKTRPDSVISRIIIIESENDVDRSTSSADSSYLNRSSSDSSDASSATSSTHSTKGPVLPYAALIDAVGSTYQLSPFFFQEPFSVSENQYLRLRQQAGEEDILLSYPDGAFEIRENPLLETCSPPTTLKLHFQGDYEHAPNLSIVVKQKDEALSCNVVNSLSHLHNDYNLPTNVPVLELLKNLRPEQYESAIKRPIEYLGPFLSVIEAYFTYEVLRLRQAHTEWMRMTMITATILGGYQDELLSKRWRLTRLIIEDFDLMVGKLVSIQEDGVLASPKLQPAFERYRRMLARARLLEQHIRDDIQLNVGNLSLQESRKSLQQADNIGRISILAFVFVPVSLVTSFFGMNIKEVTGSGAPWRTFLISAAGLCVALLLVCAWLWRRTIRSWLMPLRIWVHNWRARRRRQLSES